MSPKEVKDSNLTIADHFGFSLPIIATINHAPTYSGSGCYLRAPSTQNRGERGKMKERLQISKSNNDK